MIKKVLSWFLALALLVGAIAGTVYLCQKNNDKRTLTVDENLGKEIVFVMAKGDTEEKNALDITSMKYITVGDTIKTTETVFIGAVADAGEEFEGLVISGVEKTDTENKYIVIDNVKITVVTQEVAE